MKKPVVLVIMDGFGMNPSDKNNAIASANTPNLDKIFATCPTTQIGASGMDVGLPDGQMGNSEVGHTNIGAGRVVYQELTRITKSIADGDFFENETLKAAMEHCKIAGKKLHLLGLLSNGGVHSHNSHLWALLQMAKQMGLEKVFVHGLLDGRDVPPTSGKDFVAEALAKMEEIGTGTLATLAGRYYGMDRDTQWGRVEKAYNAMVCAQGLHADCPVKAVETSYETKDEDGKFITDEFLVPTVFGDYDGMDENDAVIFFNFRPDRAREITRAFVDPAFDGFARQKGFFPLTYVCMTEYDATMPNVDVAFKPQVLTMTMGETLSKNGKTQLRIAETTKYAHVTFFYNGGEEVKFEGEDRILIPTPDVSTFDLMPEMSAVPVCDAVCEAIETGQYDAVILNFANCDMVGHTGIFDAAVKAVETVDTCVGRVVDSVNKMGGITLITADHGNADYMAEEDGTPFTAHTTYPVPFSVCGMDCKLRQGGRLADISPTMLEILGIEKPAEMTGESLLAH